MPHWHPKGPCCLHGSCPPITAATLAAAAAASDMPVPHSFNPPHDFCSLKWASTNVWYLACWLRFLCAGTALCSTDFSLKPVLTLGLSLDSWSLTDIDLSPSIATSSAVALPTGSVLPGVSTGTLSGASPSDCSSHGPTTLRAIA